MGKDHPRRARYRSLQSGAKTAGFLGVRDACGSNAVDAQPGSQSRHISFQVDKGIRGGEEGQEENEKEGEEGQKSPPARATEKAAKKRVTKTKRVAKKAKKSAKKSVKKAPRSRLRKRPRRRRPRNRAKKSAQEIGEEADGEETRRRAEPGKRSQKGGEAESRRHRARRPFPPAAPAPAPSRGNTYYITTAIAYPNGMPHIGHAYEAIATDALARFQRLDGKDVFFLTGTDEHGQKMIQTAQAEGHDAGRARDPQRRPLQGDGRAAERLVRPLHPHHGAGASPFGPGDLESDAAERRHLHRHLCRLVFGARRGLLRRGRNRRRRGQCAPRPAGHAGRMGRGEELFLQAVGLSGQAAGALREPARFHRAGLAHATRSSASSRAA